MQIYSQNRNLAFKGVSLQKNGSWQETVNHDEVHDGSRKPNIKLAVLSPALGLADVTNIGLADLRP